jgi:hypothetical protein
MKQIASLTAVVTQLQAEKSTPPPTQPQQQQVQPNILKTTVTFALNQRSSHTQTSHINQDELTTLPQHLERSSTTQNTTKPNHSDSSTQTDTHSTHHYKALLNKYEKQYNAKLRYNNHHNILTTHQTNNTEPARIAPKCWHIPTNMFNSFDLQRKIERAVINAYMSETTDYIAKSITTMNNQLDTLTEQLSAYHNNRNDVKKDIERIHTEVPKNLTETIEKSWAKAQKIIVQKHQPSSNSPQKPTRHNQNQPTTPRKQSQPPPQTRQNHPQTRNARQENTTHSLNHYNHYNNTHHNQEYYDYYNDYHNNYNYPHYTSHRSRSRHNYQTHSNNRSRSPTKKQTQHNSRK